MTSLPEKCSTAAQASWPDMGICAMLLAERSPWLFGGMFLMVIISITGAMTLTNYLWGNKTKMLYRQIIDYFTKK
jgi:hypothetical protein